MSISMSKRTIEISLKMKILNVQRIKLGFNYHGEIHIEVCKEKNKGKNTGPR